jgi:uncharacterized protein (DUF1800 family)
MRKFPILFALLWPVAATAPAGEMAPESPSLAPLPDSAWTPAHAAHLLRRAGFGGTPGDIRRLHALGLDGAVDRLLDWTAPDEDVPRPGVTLTSRPGRAELMALQDREERRKLTREYRRRDRLQHLRIREWWMQTMVQTVHPLRERLVLFWHGHFTSGYRDVRNSYHMYVQNTLFRRHAAGSFRTLLHAISKDPAMLEYLDNRSNRKEHPNENYAREVMELFTLGVGNYTEEDIHEAARALTGWTLVGNRFHFDERQHDTGVKRFLGREGNFGGDEVLDIILEQPAAARHLATRLFRYFAYENPDGEIVDGLAQTLTQDDWELRPALRRLFRSQAFYSARATGTKIKSPVEFVVGLHKSLGLDGRKSVGLSLHAQMLGQELMDPPNVKGWPGGREWITTSNLFNRYNVAGAIVGLERDKARALQGQGRASRTMRMLERMRRVDPNGEEMEGMDPDMDRAKKRRRGRRQPLPTFDVLEEVSRRGLSTAEEIVSHFGRALLAVPMSTEMRATLLSYLARDGGFNLENADAKERLHGLLRLIVATPEFQLT